MVSAPDNAPAWRHEEHNLDAWSSQPSLQPPGASHELRHGSAGRPIAKQICTHHYRHLFDTQRAPNRQGGDFVTVTGQILFVSHTSSGR